MSEGLLDKFIDYVFGMKRRTIYLILILALGLVLRIIAAINLGVSADDMHFVTHAINFLSADRLVTYDQSSGLWFALTSLAYKIFGFTQLGSRFAVVIFGSFSILVIYLLSREFFDEKVSLIAAFLLAIAPFHIKNTIAEMDVMAMFFVLMSMILFVKALKKNKKSYLIISGVFMGLAIYTKVYPLLFIPSLLIYFVYSSKKQGKKIFVKNNAYKLLIFLAVIFLFTIPAITHNYLLYKDKGFLDLQFTRTLGLGKNVSAEYYSWDAQFDAKNSWKGLIFGDTKHVASGTPLSLAALGFVFNGDPIIFILGVLGIVLVFINKRESHINYLVFFALSIIFVFPFLASIILLPKHFLFLEIFMTPLAALSVNWINEKASAFAKKDLIKIVLAILLVLALFHLGGTDMRTPFYSKSDVSQIIDYKYSEISQDALMVSDSRIYRGRINWFSQGRYYLEGSEFIQIVNNQESLPGETIRADVYFIECISDDCGWGTVKDQPEFNASIESLVEWFKQNGKLVKTIEEPDKEKSYYPLVSEKKGTINIYQAEIPLKKSVFSIANQPKSWFLYNIGYFPIESNFDYYITYNAIDKFLNSLAHWLVFLSVALALISPIYLIRLLIKDENIYNSSSLQRREDHRESP